MSALLEDADGRLWVGTLGGGLCWTETTGPDADAGNDGLTFLCHRHDPARSASLSHDHVRALTQDAGGLIWVGTALWRRHVGGPTASPGRGPAGAGRPGRVASEGSTRVRRNNA